MNRPPFRVDAEGKAVLLRLLVGFVAAACAHQNALIWAGGTLVLCVWLDAAIGWVFRPRGPKTSSTSALEIGADLVCFVVAPMEFAAALSFHPQVLLVLLVFLVASIYRLARFQIEGLAGRSYRGLPVTYNGYAFPLAGLVIHFMPGWTDYVLAGVLLVISALMVSRHLPIPEF